MKLSLLHSDQHGQGLVEYSLVVALLLFSAVSVMSLVAGDISNLFSAIASTLQGT
jgi:Flp pilus assembly pilin Flp